MALDHTSESSILYSEIQKIVNTPSKELASEPDSPLPPGVAAARSLTAESGDYKAASHSDSKTESESVALPDAGGMPAVWGMIAKDLDKSSSPISSEVKSQMANSDSALNKLIATFQQLLDAQTIEYRYTPLLPGATLSSDSKTLAVRHGIHTLQVQCDLHFNATSAMSENTLMLLPLGNTGDHIFSAPLSSQNVWLQVRGITGVQTVRGMLELTPQGYALIRLMKSSVEELKISDLIQSDSTGTEISIHFNTLFSIDA